VTLEVRDELSHRLLGDLRPPSQLADGRRFGVRKLKDIAMWGGKPRGARVRRGARGAIRFRGGRVLEAARRGSLRASRLAYVAESLTSTEQIQREHHEVDHYVLLA
jgi:hypothetical protein